MIDPKYELRIARQAELVSISRSAVYYAPRLMSEADLALQRRWEKRREEPRCSCSFNVV
jgi:putative transposase